MPVGTLTGETVSKLLISSVAANTQALENWGSSPTERQTTPRMSLAQLLKIICYTSKQCWSCLIVYLYLPLIFSIDLIIFWSSWAYCFNTCHVDSSWFRKLIRDLNVFPSWRSLALFRAIKMFFIYLDIVFSKTRKYIFRKKKTLVFTHSLRHVSNIRFSCSLPGSFSNISFSRRLPWTFSNIGFSRSLPGTFSNNSFWCTSAGTFPNSVFHAVHQALFPT